MGEASQFIAGRLAEGTSGQTDDVVDPSNGQVIQTVTLAGAEDVDAAVSAAAAAYPEWSGATPAERSTRITECARLLGERAADLAAVESRRLNAPKVIHGLSRHAARFF